MSLVNPKRQENAPPPLLIKTLECMMPLMFSVYLEIFHKPVSRVYQCKENIKDFGQSLGFTFCSCWVRYIMHFRPGILLMEPVISILTGW